MPQKAVSLHNQLDCWELGGICWIQQATLYVVNLPEESDDAIADVHFAEVAEVVSADHAASCVVDGLDVQVAPGEVVAVGAARAVKASAHFAVDRRPANRTNFVGKEAVEQLDIVDLVGDALIKIIFSEFN